MVGLEDMDFLKGLKTKVRKKAIEAIKAVTGILK
jgi:hypothetical protein